MQDRIVYITRKESFSAAHRLNSNQLSAEENRRLYGKCNHENSHGHNYEMEITVKGPVNKSTGMVMNLVLLKDIIMKVVDELDHKNLDKDINFFKENPSTCENVSIYFWDQISNLMKEKNLECSLYEVVVHETKNNKAIYRGE